MSDGAEQSKNSDNHKKVEHLKPHQWKPGQSGNPSGRPKGAVSLTAKLRQALEVEIKPGLTTADLLVKVAIKAASKGDYKFWKEILDRIDGKVPDKIQTDDPIKVIVEYASKNDDDQDTTD